MENQPGDNLQDQLNHFNEFFRIKIRNRVNIRTISLDNPHHWSI